MVYVFFNLHYFNTIKFKAEINESIAMERKLMVNCGLRVHFY